MEEIARIKIEQGKETVEGIKANPLLLMCGLSEKICRKCLKVKDAENDFEPLNRKCRQCKLTNNRERDNDVNYEKIIEILTEFTKDLRNTPTELKTKIKVLRKAELILIISELKLGRSKDDVKDDMVKNVYKYFVSFRE
jgi:hypothetical protein